MMGLFNFAKDIGKNGKGSRWATARDWRLWVRWAGRCSCPRETMPGESG